jgi:hypothetical protein
MLVFVEEAAETVASADVKVRGGGRFRDRGVCRSNIELRSLSWAYAAS